MNRLSLAVALGLGSTFAIFVFMSALVTSQSHYQRNIQDSPVIQFVRLKEDSRLEERKREIPKKPPEIKEPPKMERMKVADNTPPEKPRLEMDIPKLDIALGKGGDGPYLGQAMAGGGNGEVMPLVRIEPQYPRKAAMEGLEGWVTLQFDITEAGTVTNVEVLDSQPQRIFDSEARRALLKWKYKPKVIDGQAHPQPKNVVRLDFKLES